MKFSHPILSVSGLAIVLGAFIAGDAMAVTQARTLYSNPTGYCQAALPVFETNLRKRPVAVQNEGSSNAFVSCAFTSQFSGADNKPTEIGIYAQNLGSVARDLTCTLVTGFATGPLNQNITKTVTLPVGGAQRLTTWEPADFSGGDFPNFGPYSMSCNLLPGVGLNDSYINFMEDVGA